MTEKKINRHEYCEICKDNRPFIFPPDLFDALVQHKLVIFAGAGISTEQKNVFPYTLYEDILGEMGYPPNSDISFPKLMSEYCKKTGDKKELVKRIKERIDYICSFPELYRSATKFHSQLAIIPCITEIVTTNWDDYFETECHATPFVYEQDMAFWDETKRRVLKLHGSINNLGSLVATSEDYDECYKSLNTGLVGSQLKLLIANRRLVFIGYSFGDEDFNSIYSFVCGQLSGFMKKPYIVTLDEQNDTKWRALGLEPIYTAGEFFLQEIVHKLEIEGCMFSVSVINSVYQELDIMREEHTEFARRINLHKYPEAIYCLSYQDGIIHAFEHFLHHVYYGQSLCKANIQRIIEGYEKLTKEKRKIRKYHDVAYIIGYLNGYLFPIPPAEERDFFPRYFDFNLGNEARTFDEYMDSLNITEGRKKLITNFAKKIVEKQLPAEDLIYHHTAFLL